MYWKINWHFPHHYSSRKYTAVQSAVHNRAAACVLACGGIFKNQL
jgi:hypothetical protein